MCRSWLQAADLLHGSLTQDMACRVAKGWYDSGYIFPEGYVSQLAFRSSVELDQTCVHVCSIIGQGGQFWPAPTFKITALDREDAPLFGKSCTACWTQVGSSSGWWGLHVDDVTPLALGARSILGKGTCNEQCLYIHCSQGPVREPSHGPQLAEQLRMFRCR